MAILGCTAGIAFGSEKPLLDIGVKIGIRGVWKVGYPTSHRIAIQSTSPIRGAIGIQTCDGDGVPVLYRDDRWKFDLQSNQSAELEAIVTHGRANRPIHVVVFSEDGQTLVGKLISEEERGRVLPATQPWVMGIGRDLNLDQAAMKSTKGALPDYSTIQVDDPRDLSSDAEAYRGIDLLILSSSSDKINSQISETQSSAIRNWVEQGGRCVLSIGKGAPGFLQQSHFAALVPGKLQMIASDCDPAILESLVGTQNESGKTERLNSLECAVVELDGVLADLTAQTGSRARFPLIARWAVGLGKVHFFASEFDSQQLAGWANRTALLRYFLKDQWEKGDHRSDKRVYQGYDDLSGQLNATLDFFPNLKLGNLAQLSLIAGLLSLIIGPLDYFLVSKAWNRPRATWLTLITCCVGGCLIVAGLNRSWKPSQPSINSLEIIDVDLKSNRLLGHGFAHCYGGTRGAFDFTARHTSLAPKQTSSGESHSPSVRLDWLGQPGRGLGGFDSMVATDREMPTYRIVSDGEGVRSLESVGIPAAGTKAMSATWTEEFDIPTSTYALTTVTGSADLLEGSFANPLDIDLLNGFLLYRGRAYSLPARLRSGDRMTYSAATIPKDISRRLQRRQNVAGEDKGTPWDPAETGKLDRLCELLCFHRAAGADAYSSLYHRYLSSLDCSDLLRLDRAVLFAEVSNVSLGWSLRRNGLPVQAVGGEHRSFVRLIIPVAPRTKSSSSPPKNASDSSK